MEIGQRLKLLRERQQMTIKEVAAELGVAASTYREWELGTKISGEPYGRMAFLFKTSLSFILTGEEIRNEYFLEEIQQIRFLLDQMEKRIHINN